MRIANHPLTGATPGATKTITSLHFGEAGRGLKVYLQASLHADELPGMLVLHHLRSLLIEAEAQGRMRGEVVLVPVANPLGLAQTLMHGRIGRFDLATGQNFNRHYADFFAALRERIEPRLGQHAEENVRLIRAEIRALAAALPVRSELDSMRKQLVQLACDADVVLDLHCDTEAIVHVYTESPCWPQAEPFCRLLGAETVLLARGSGALSFDEAHSGLWWQLAEHFAGRFPIPQACFAATVELRGQADVYHPQARADAERMFDYLLHIGIVAGAAPELPEMQCEPTPLAGSETLVAPSAGLIVFRRELGEFLQIGDAVVDIVDPVYGQLTTVHAGVAGRLYARESRRFATAGMDLCKIAGAKPFRTGALLGA